MSGLKEVRNAVDAEAERMISEACGIVSAGGKGVRLRPQTLERPKPLLEIGSPKHPLMFWSMLPMILGGISRFVVGVRYGADKIRKTFGSGDGLSEQFGRPITIDYVEEPQPLGRAGFVKYAIEKHVVDPRKPAVIFNASDILRLNLRDLFRHYLWLNACHGLEVVQVYTSQFRAPYGIGALDLSSFRVVQFEEKPLRPDLASTACYVTHCRLADFTQIERTPSNPEDGLLQRWIAEKLVGAYVIPYDDFISIKFEEDLAKVESMDLEDFVRSAYE
jgi:mannose-1-phosphate guanylyltransferase